MERREDDASEANAKAHGHRRIFKGVDDAVVAVVHVGL